jgi:hypothetical protein
MSNTEITKKLVSLKKFRMLQKVNLKVDQSLDKRIFLKLRNFERDLIFGKNKEKAWEDFCKLKELIQRKAAEKAEQDRQRAAQQTGDDDSFSDVSTAANTSFSGEDMRSENGEIVENSEIVENDNKNDTINEEEI